MAKAAGADLSRRERQIMDILYRDGVLTAAEIMERLPEAPSYSAVRALLRILEEKGHVTHAQDGPRYVFSATVPQREARRGALRHLVETFFENSTEQAMAALLELQPRDEEELERMARMIEEARSAGSGKAGRKGGK